MTSMGCSCISRSNILRRESHFCRSSTAKNVILSEWQSKKKKKQKWKNDFFKEYNHILEISEAFRELTRKTECRHSSANKVPKMEIVGFLRISLKNKFINLRDFFTAKWAYQDKVSGRSELVCYLNMTSAVKMPISDTSLVFRGAGRYSYSNTEPFRFGFWAQHPPSLRHCYLFLGV